MSAAATLRRLLALRRDRGGSIAVELAFGMALLVPMLLMGVELGRFVLIQQKLERLSATVGDLASRADVSTVSQAQAIFAAVPHVMDPFPFATHGVVILSGVSAGASGAPSVTWQVRGGGTVADASRIGVQGGAATLPGGLTLAPNESVVVAEVHFRYAALLLSVIEGRTLYDRTLFRPRLSDQPIIQ